MLQTLRCVKFGEILMDKNRSLQLLCTNCHSAYESLPEFNAHIRTVCYGLEHLFQENTTLTFDTKKGTRLIGKSLNGDIIKNYFIYNSNEVGVASENNLILQKDESFMDMDLIKIEEELLNPRWYSDLKVDDNDTQFSQNVNTQTPDKILEYNELVEAVTPFVHFKENVKSAHETYAKTTATRTVVPTKTYSNNTKNKKQTISLVTSKNTLSNGSSSHSAIVDTVNTFNVGPIRTLQKLPVQPKLNKPVIQILHTENKPVVVESAQSRILVPPTESKPRAITKRRKTIAIPILNVATINAAPTMIIENHINTAQVANVIPATTQSLVSTATKTLQQNQSQNSQLLPTAKSMKNVSFQVSMPQSTIALVPVTTAPPLVLALPQEQIVPAKVKQTEQILNKLQTLGLQVKRRTNTTNLTETAAATTTADDKTMELLKKLQSKGMKVKIVNKQADNLSTPTNESASKRVKWNTANNSTGIVTKQTFNTLTPNGHVVNKTNFNKNLIIKKIQ